MTSMLIKVITYSTLTVYTFVAIGLFIFGFRSLLCWTLGFLMLMLVLPGFLYLHGLSTENNWVMLPFLVTELIVRLLVSTVLILSWIVYLLSRFHQIRIESPVGLFTSNQFLLAVAVIVTIVFIVMVRIYFPLYNEYRILKKLNDRRRMERGNDTEENYVRMHFSARPTDL